MLVGDNGVIALTGAATLPGRRGSAGAVGPPLVELATVDSLRDRSPGAIAVAVVVVSFVGILVPRLVPAVPPPAPPAAWLLLAVGLACFAALAVRAANTYLLTRRAADLAVVVGLVLLGASLYGALVLTGMDLGWWLGHAGELVGITLVGASVAYDLRRAASHAR